MKKLVPLLSICILLFTACNSDNDDIPIIVATEIYNFTGTVVDGSNAPIENATITLTTHEVTTDENGNFTLNNVTLETDYAYIKVTKDDYIGGLRMLTSLEENNTIKFSLLNDHLVTILGTGGDSEVNFPTGLKFKINGNIKKEDGSPFAGFMYPVIHHITPFNLAIETIIPGENSMSEDNYGFVYVKLEDATKNWLDIANGHSATLEFDIDDDLLPTAPETVKVYNFNKETGLWILYGTATKTKILDVWVYQTTIASFKNAWFKLEAE
ncbi:carboxypeptidase-like regulatory domain-containing protein [Tenacibaculum soleae]|uniref:carboxypeptidase-like regulatory domain-containing protein n=1 Tax=Tenacibaculum soleae TaxID=447689 RepID=UPI0026E21C01|nr:carboxypeptidase-like regulatory domain-containing protein [Tenacibaculum soleae]MDO6811601.1 carboxypeptidase-like regulatory domain-containing protein [Tenacibaculum soleae]